MSETTWKCDGCPSREIPCLFIDSHEDGNIPNNQFTRCGPYDAHWTKTKPPEPVHYLDIPNELRVTVDSKLEQKNGTIIKVFEETEKGIVEIKLSNGEYWNVLPSWLKQKPQPTAEELQERIDKIGAFVPDIMWDDEKGVWVLRK